MLLIMDFSPPSPASTVNGRPHTNSTLNWQNYDVSLVILTIAKFDPWSTSDRIFQICTGCSTNYFRFKRGQTPFSTFREVAVCLSAYYVVVFGGRELMRSRAPMRCQSIVIIHNLYLTIISAGLFVLFAQQILPMFKQNILYDGICGEAGWSQQLLVLYYMNYLIKYLELFDTVFLVLQKKPLALLHTYHHGATVLLCYIQFNWTDACVMGPSHSESSGSCGYVLVSHFSAGVISV